MKPLQNVHKFLGFGLGLLVTANGMSWADGKPGGSPLLSFVRSPPPTQLHLGESVRTARPQGALLAFSAFVEGNWDIYTWDFDPQHAPVRRTDTPYDESGPSLAPDHSFCVYETVDGRVWRVELRPGTKPEELPPGSDQKFDMHPAVSPDGRAVVLATNLDRRTDDSDLIVFDLATGKHGRRLEMMAYQHYPAWAPDGRHVAFGNLHDRLQTGGPLSEIWVMRVDAPWARQITLMDAVSASPSWSPEGRWIVFESNRDGDFNLWLVDPFTRAYSQLTDHPAADTDPVFGPEGIGVIFESTRSGTLELWKIDVASGNATPVRPFGSEKPLPCRDPDWK